jgi:lipoprotein Spr
MQTHVHIKCAALLLAVMYLSSCKHHKTAVKSPKPAAKKTASLNSSGNDKKTVPDTTDTKNRTGDKLPGSSVIRATYAERLKVSESDIKNEKLYKFIDDWYAVPYKYAGKDKKGIDCSGFTSVLCSTVYNKKVSSSSKAIYEETKRVNVSDLKEGDLVFFIINGKSVSHVGVYLQHNKFVHASTRRGVIISDLDEPYYKKYYHGGGRIK